jgi:hypothetical protein
MALHDDGRQALLTCQGAADSGFTRQTLCLDRPSRLTLTRDTDNEQAWWCYGKPARQGNILRWEDGTTLEVKTGELVSVDQNGYHDEKVVGMGRLKLVDPLPMTYPLIRARPQARHLKIEVRLTEH